MLRRNHYLTVEVRAVRSITERVKTFELHDPDDWELPPFTPGAHVEVHLPGDHARKYSLFGDPHDSRRYHLGVLLQSDGRGGSLAFHTRVEPGTVLSISLPKNHFPLASSAERHIFIAGGIGITPFLSMIPAVVRAGEDFVLHYCTRTPADTPFLEKLAPFAESGRVVVHHDDGDPRQGLDVSSLLRTRRDGDHVYCCGPEPLMQAVQVAAAHWPAGTVHFERFNPPAPLPAKDGATYVLELARSGTSIEVAPGQSMAGALLAAGVGIDLSCEAGTCGSCRTRYLAGKPEHRDFVLRAEERGEFLMPCVSSCRAGPIVLDL
jgi:vanillate O-demethylase ferredoxin subunit